MGHKFAEIAFTKSVREIQEQQGSRVGYESWTERANSNDQLGAMEADFIEARDSFYMSSVSETGWPYLQHRGGPGGFMKVIDAKTIGFADFSGNRQYISTGNFQKNDRVALFFMDYPNRTRLKVLGTVKTIGDDDLESLAKLEVSDYRARVERGFLIHIEAFDWNCPQHITPRYTESYIDQLMAPLTEENERLRSKDHVSERPTSLGNGPLELTITGIRELTPRVRAYELRSPDGSDLPAVEAGSHLKIPVRLESGENSTRNYSICSNPARRDVYEIAVLREEKGSGGSKSVHGGFDLGLSLHCEMPENLFRLHDDDRPAVLIAGGIGITPIKSMAQALKRRGTAFNLHYAGRARNDMAFRDRLERDLAEDIHIHSGADDLRLDVEQLMSSAAEGAVFYVCGPARLIDDVIDTGARFEIDSDRIRFERFSVTTNPEATAIELTLQRSGKQITVAADQTILDAILGAGVDMPYSCQSGQCKTCVCTVLEGEPDHQDSVLSAEEREEQSLMCPCVSRAKTSTLKLDI